MAKTDLTAQRLRELLHYDPETGIFTRLVQTSRRIKVGQVAGSPKKCGYLYISVDSIVHKAHRLAWLYVTGNHPKGPIDHANGDTSDNRFQNLRDVTVQMNSQNQRKAHKDKAHRFLGVHQRKEAPHKWRAVISVNYKNISLGDFSSPEAAHDAYLAAKRRLHQACTI